MTKQPYLVFDIETKGIPALVDRYGDKYEEFDESAVKYGNARDAQKRAEILAQKRADHEAGRDAFMAAQRAKAALNPFTAQVLCIGVKRTGQEPHIIAESSEARTLDAFWKMVGNAMDIGNGMHYAAAETVFYSGCGDPSKKFDLDFIVTRSRILGIPVPDYVRRGRFYHESFVDLAEVFLLSQRDKYLSLSKCADLLGIFDAHDDVIRKTDEDVVTGANFAQFWEQNSAGRELATSYLLNDVRLAAHIADRIL
jgi:hypothetical protein